MTQDMLEDVKKINLIDNNVECGQEEEWLGKLIKTYSGTRQNAIVSLTTLEKAMKKKLNSKSEVRKGNIHTDVCKQQKALGDCVPT